MHVSQVVVGVEQKVFEEGVQERLIFVDAFADVGEIATDEGVAEEAEMLPERLVVRGDAHAAEVKLQKQCRGVRIAFEERMRLEPPSWQRLACPQSRLGMGVNPAPCTPIAQQ